MAHLRWIHLAGTAALMAASVAAADALHGFCSDCRGDSPLGATAAGPLTDFGFWDSGKNNTGTYFIDILTPDNAGASAPSGMYTLAGAATGAAALFSPTAWTGGKLDSYLGIQASPSNPLNTWLHATQSLDPKAMGYWVFQANLGLNTLGTSSGTGPLFKLSSALPPGSVIVAFLETGATSNEASARRGNSNDDDHRDGMGSDHGNDNDHSTGKSSNSNVFTATANGSALFETSMTAGQPDSGSPGGDAPGTVGSTTGQGVPEPGTAGLLATALLEFAVMLLRRRLPLSA